MSQRHCLSRLCPTHSKTKLKPNQFIGALDLLKYKPVTVQVDVSNLKPPLEYYFRYPPAGELNIWFSSRTKPTQEKHDVCISNRQQWTFESPGKLPKNETHYFTFEAQFDCQCFLSLQLSQKSGEKVSIPKQPQLRSITQIMSQEIFQKQPKETVIEMIERLTNTQDELLTQKLARIEQMDLAKQQKKSENKRRKYCRKSQLILSRDDAVTLAQQRRDLIDDERKVNKRAKLLHHETRKQLRLKILEQVIGQRAAQFRVKGYAAFKVLK